MTSKFFNGKYKVLAAVIICALIFVIYIYRIPIWEKYNQYYSFFTDREKIKTFITSYGMGGPVVFITFQILQVLFAPVPGEATGFIGGYLFGTAMGFLYSSIGLTAGSLINFIIGRFLGKRYIRKLIPDSKLNRFDTFLKRQGIFVLFALFLFPGFPKDYLSLFLGITAIPLNVFFFLAAIGRMPGTFILSLQGASLFEQNYISVIIIAIICLVAAFFAYRYREDVYHWIGKFNNK